MTRRDDIMLFFKYPDMLLSGRRIRLVLFGPRRQNQKQEVDIAKRKFSLDVSKTSQQLELFQSGMICLAFSLIGGLLEEAGLSGLL